MWVLMTLHTVASQPRCLGPGWGMHEKSLILYVAGSCTCSSFKFKSITIAAAVVVIIVVE